MKGLKMSELNNLGVDELKDKLAKLKKQLFEFRFQAKTGKLEKQTSLHDTKRDIARILTAINQTGMREPVQVKQPAQKKQTIEKKGKVKS